MPFLASWKGIIIIHGVYSTLENKDCILDRKF